MNIVRRFIASVKAMAPVLVLLALVIAAVAFPEAAFAAEEADQPLPYQKGIETFYTSMTGPVPFIISLIGIVGCGAMLIFGGEISGFMRTMVFIVLVVAVIVQASSVVRLLGGNWNGKPPGQVSNAPRHGPVGQRG